MVEAAYDGPYDGTGGKWARAAQAGVEIPHK